MVKVKIAILLFFVLGGSYYVKAQPENDFPEESRSFWQRLYFGGGLSLQFGTFTYIDVSPLIGYGITERLSVGTGFTYRFVNDSNWNYRYSVYGGRLFSRFGIIQNIFAHAEYEFLNWEDIRRDRSRQWSGALFAGGGYSSHLGGQKGYQIYALYNLTYNQFKSPYNDPYVIRFSLTF
jgi:hypothetical protein